MGKINIVLKDETEKQFRRAIAEYIGIKKGNISSAMEEAIDLWIDYRSRVSLKTSMKAKIGWS